MSFRKDVDEMMKNVQVDYEMTNNIMNNTVRNSGKKYRGFRKKAIVVVTLATLCIRQHLDSLAPATNGSWS